MGNSKKIGELNERIQKQMCALHPKCLVPPFPKKNMLIEVTNFCNHKCIFCANSKMTRRRGFIKQELLYRVLTEAYDLGVREVGFYATGEPLLNKFIGKYIKKAKDIGYTYVYLTTNGALLTPEKSKVLLESGIDSVKFSINAGSSESYEKIHGYNDFEKVIENLKCFDHARKEKKASVRLFVSCILNKINKEEKEVLRNILNGYIDDIVFVNVRNQGGLMYKETNPLMIDDDVAMITTRVPCPMVFNSITVTHEGFMSACCVDFQNYLVVADLNQLSLKEAWESKAFQELRKRHLENDLQGTMCYNCIYNQNESMEPLNEKYATRF